MANKILPAVNPTMGIRRFAGPTKFDWIAMSWENPWILLRPLWLPKAPPPKPRFPPGYTSGKPPPRWPKDRKPVLSYIYVNVRLFKGLEGIQENNGDLSQQAFSPGNGKSSTGGDYGTLEIIAPIAVLKNQQI